MHVTKLAAFCGFLWILGLVGMGVSRAFFDCGPGNLGFDVAARAWAVGGLTYCLIGGIHVLDEARGSRG